MKPFRRLLLLLLLLPFISKAQFGPRKKDLQLRIDTLEMISGQQGIVIDNLRFRDSVSFSELKRMANEVRDLKKLMIELNGDIREIREANERLKEENRELQQNYEALMEEVKKHDILIRNVIGGDSSDVEEIEENNAPSVTEAEVAVQNFAEFAEEFISTLKEKGELGLKEYLNGEESFYYLSKPGFITSVAEVKDVRELTEEIPWRAGLDAFRKSKFSLQEGEKPRINCEMADLYNKRGCYGGLEENFDKVSKALIALKEFSPDEESELNGKIEEIQRSEKSVVTYIFSTDGNLGFYFIKKGDTWRLYCLEVEDPCSA